jgi:hypothetical protein
MIARIASTAPRPLELPFRLQGGGSWGNRGFPHVEMEGSVG